MDKMHIHNFILSSNSVNVILICLYNILYNSIIEKVCVYIEKVKLKLGRAYTERQGNL